MRQAIKIEDREKFSLNLIDFARAGDLEGVRELLDRGIAPNYVKRTVEVDASIGPVFGHVSTTHPQETALTAAIENNHIDVARLLLERKADVSLCDPVRRWVNKNKNKDRLQDLELLKLLLNYNPDLNQEKPDTYSSLRFMLKHEEVALLLIQHGADVNNFTGPGRVGRSILHEAMEYKSPVVIKALVDNGAKLDTVSYVRVTGWQECCLLLLSIPCLAIPFICWIESSTGYHRGFTPLQYARHCNLSPEIISILRNPRQSPAVQLSASPAALLAQNKPAAIDDAKKQAEAPALGMG